MKKRVIALLVVMVCLLSMPVKVLAYNEEVKITKVEAAASKVTVEGTTDALAVMVQVRDKDGNILIMESTGTVDGKYAISLEQNLSLECEEEYTIYVADYEGGAWATESVTIEHAYGAYSYNNDATCEKDGTKTATCSVCNKKDTVADASHKATGHKDANNDGKCDVCGKKLFDPTTEEPTTAEPTTAEPTTAEPTTEAKPMEVVPGTTETQKEAPKTGDYTPIVLLATLMMLSGAGIVISKLENKEQK